MIGKKKPLLGATNNFEKLNYTEKILNMKIDLVQFTFSKLSIAPNRGCFFPPIIIHQEITLNNEGVGSPFLERI